MSIENKLTPNAKYLLEKRYLRRDKEGNIIETPDGMVRRVCKHIAQAEGENSPYWEEQFYNIISDLYFMPASPILFNSGTSLGLLSSCFVIPIEDDIEKIFDAVKETALICKGGGGVGFNVSKLRPKDFPVGDMIGIASGPLSFMKIFDRTVEILRQGGRRKGALLATMKINHIDIFEFITCKKDDPSSFTNFNLSVGITDKFMEAVFNDEEWELYFNGVIKKVSAKSLFDLIVESAWSSGDPGILYLDRINTDNPIPRVAKIKSGNPCITGDTMVAVADGRQYVSISQLAGENKDVPVYTMDDNKKIAIRKMINPRLTREKAPIYKILLDSGDYIRATEDHKFVMKNGTIKKVKNLVNGDSLQIMNKIIRYANKKKQKYIDIELNRNRKLEHRMVAEYYTGRDLKRYEVVHHKNYNGSDNSIENLKVMSFDNHVQLHRENMLGNKNPMIRAKIEWSEEKWEQYRKKMSKSVSGEKNGRYINAKKEDIEKHLKYLTYELKRRVLKRDWFKYVDDNNLNYPKEFSRYRNKIYKFTPLSKRIYREYRVEELNDCGYNAKIINNKIVILKICKRDGCDENILVDDYYKNRTNFCSYSCSTKYNMRDPVVLDKFRNSFLKINESKKEDLREKQYKVFEELKYKINRVPEKKEWAEECKKQGISHEICRDSSPFRYWKDLKNYNLLYNHKIVSVEFDGYEDVYNGTVEDFHNFFIGKFEKEDYTSSICVKNCSEFVYHDGSSCTLGSINLSRFVKENKEIDYKKLKEVVRLAVRFLDDVIDVNVFPIKYIEKMTKSTRPIGIGCMGIADLFVKLGIKYGSKDSFEYINGIMNIIEEESVRATEELAKEKGSFPLCDKSIYIGSPRRNSVLRSIAPTGSIAIIAGCSSGIEPLYSLANIRQCLEGKIVEINQDFVNTLKERGLYKEEIIQKLLEGESLQNIEDISQDIKDIFVTAHDIGYEQHIETQACFQKYTDLAISKTVNLSSNASRKTVRNAFFKAWKMGCKGVTVFRNGCKGNQVLQKLDNKCPSCNEELTKREGCLTCPSCGWGLCSLS